MVSNISVVLKKKLSIPTSQVCLLWYLLEVLWLCLSLRSMTRLEQILLCHVKWETRVLLFMWAVQSIHPQFLERPFFPLFVLQWVLGHKLGDHV